MVADDAVNAGNMLSEAANTVVAAAAEHILFSSFMVNSPSGKVPDIKLLILYIYFRYL